MSSIPASAMPHAYAHDEAEETSRRGSAPSGLLLGGAAIAAYFLFRMLR